MDVDVDTVVCTSLANPNRVTPAPFMHNAGYARLGLKYVYVAFEPSDIGSALAALRCLGIRGASISMPFKEAAIEFVDELDDNAAAIGAINTVVNRDGRLIGYNSDWIGAVRALEKVTSLGGARVTLLGAGGAARSIAFGLARRGANVRVYNRDADRAKALARDLGVHFGGSLDDAAASRPDMVVNATSVGFDSRDDLPVTDRIFDSTPVVFDVVYRPRRTAFLERAAARGCPVVDGARMLVYQGAFQFELFTGTPAPLDAMREAVDRALANRP